MASTEPSGDADPYADPSVSFVDNKHLSLLLIIKKERTCLGLIKKGDSSYPTDMRKRSAGISLDTIGTQTTLYIPFDECTYAHQPLPVDTNSSGAIFPCLGRNEQDPNPRAQNRVSGKFEPSLCSLCGASQHWDVARSLSAGET